MTNLKEFTLSELENVLDLPGFRIKQIYRWIHKNHAASFDEMTNLPIDLREKLKERFYASTAKIVKRQTGADKTVKYLIEFDDGGRVETVHIPDDGKRLTVCVSSQIGCPFACLFCATGKMGFKRNLSVAEILSQVYIAERVSNVVFMGMGEPFLNYEQVIKAVRILNSKEGMNIGARRITISTAGVPQGIRLLAEEPLQVRLAISLNSADDKIRSMLMPINKKYPLKEIKRAIADYQKKTGRRVTLEYVALKNINDADESVDSLVGFCKGLDVNVNLIPYNQCDPKFEASLKIKSIASTLKKRGIEAVVRVSRGEDILGACGQLAVF